MGACTRACTPTKGRLLVATPALDDPHFDRSVVFMLEHHDDGALGLVLNRPSAESLDVPLDAWVRVQSAPPRVFSGGPVEPDALIALARTRRPGRGGRRRRTSPRSRPRSPRPTSPPTRTTWRPTSRRCACSAATPGGRRGSSRWRSQSGSWLVLDSDESDVFTAEPDELWRTVLRRQPGRLGWLAEAPDDLGWN